MSRAMALVESLIGISAEAPRLGSRLLVVDQRESVCALIRRMLGAEHIVVTATGAAQAHAFLHEERFDLILYSLDMPGISGAAFYQTLEHEFPDQRKRLVILSGASRPEDQEFLESARIPVVAKPIDLKQLQRVVRRQLKRVALRHSGSFAILFGH